MILCLYYRGYKLILKREFHHVAVVPETLMPTVESIGGVNLDADQAEVLAVDENNEVQGLVSREEAHTGDGVRHRAYTVVLRDPDGRILLARRSENKQLWPGYWDGTVASHQSKGTDLRDEATGRLREELGVRPNQYDDFNRLEDFEYKAFYRDVGVEWEICSLLTVELNDCSVDPNSREVSEVRWVNPGADFKERIEDYSLLVCPWFEIALERFFENDADERPAEGS